MTHSGRFDAFVWISAGLHVLVAALVLAWALAAPRPKPPTAIFELVGIPPRGNGGGEVRSAPPEPAPPAPPAAAPETSPPAPEKAPEKPAPTPTPDTSFAKVVPKPTAAPADGSAHTTTMGTSLKLVRAVAAPAAQA